MRGWITGGHATCRCERAAHNSLQLLQRTVDLVVDDRVTELRPERELARCDVEPLVDLALALGGTRAEPLLERLAAGSGHEDGHRGRHSVAHCQRPACLDLQEGRVAVGGYAVELGPERPRPVAVAPGKLDPLQEVARG